MADLVGVNGIETTTAFGTDGKIEQELGNRVTQTSLEVLLNGTSPAVRSSQLVRESLIVPAASAISKRVSQLGYEVLVRISGITGHVGIPSATSFGSAGHVVHVLSSAEGIPSGLEFGLGVFGTILHSDAGIASGLVVDQGYLVHQITGQDGISPQSSLGQGTIRNLLILGSIHWDAESDLQIGLVQEVYRPDLVWTAQGNLEISGKVLPYYAPPEYGDPDRSGFVSALTQEMLNYFDASESRVRSSSHTIEHQLLNVAAQSMEISRTKIAREFASSYPSKTPTFVDNRGVYYKLNLPEEITRFTSISGLKGASWIQLKAYDDLLPVPSYIKRDSTRSQARLGPGESVLATIDGPDSGDDEHFVVGPFTMAVPNSLIVEVSGEVDSIVLDVHIEGVQFPETVWDASETASEEIFITTTGMFRTSKTWTRILSVTLRNVSPGMTIRLLQNDIHVQALEDPSRPYTDPSERLVKRTRLWQIRGNDLLETYIPNRFAGQQVLRTYRTQGYKCIAVEPNTFGMLGSKDLFVHYFDRREPLPHQLDVGVTEEPLYSLQVSEDTEASTPTVILTPRPTARFLEMRRFRYTITLPDETTWSIDSNGGFSELTPISGFRQTVPKEIRVPVQEPGTYLFTLDCHDTAGNLVQDKAVYRSLQVAPLSKLDASSLVPSIEGMFFDSRQSLWLWTGDLLVPVVFDYDSYIYEEDQQALYFTNKYESVKLG